MHNSTTTEANTPGPQLAPRSSLRSGRTHHVFRTFARNLSISLSAQLRYAFEFQLQGMDRRTFEEISGAFPSPACLLKFVVAPLGAPLIFSLDPSFAKRIVELLLGGQPESESEEVPTSLTEIEQHLLSDIVQLIQDELTLVLGKVGGYSLSCDGLETAPEMLRTFDSSDLVDLIALEVRAGEFGWPIAVCVPIGIADAADGDAAGEARERPVSANPQEQKPSVSDVIGSAQVEFEARLRVGALPLAAIVSLEPGQVLHLRQLSSRHLTATLNGVKHFGGHLVTTKRRRAFLIEENPDSLL